MLKAFKCKSSNKHTQFCVKKIRAVRSVELAELPTLVGTMKQEATLHLGKW